MGAIPRAEEIIIVTSFAHREPNQKKRVDEAAGALYRGPKYPQMKGVDGQAPSQEYQQLAFQSEFRPRIPF